MRKEIRVMVDEETHKLLAHRATDEGWDEGPVGRHFFKLLLAGDKRAESILREALKLGVSGKTKHKVK